MGTSIAAAINRQIIAHERGWCPNRAIDLRPFDDLGEAVELDYRTVELYEDVDVHCQSVTSGWRVALLDETGERLISHAEAYGQQYPGDDEVRQACCTLIDSWRGVLARRQARREAAAAFATDTAGLITLRRIARAAEHIEAGRLALAETAAAIGVTEQAIQDELDRRAWERRDREDAAAMEAAAGAMTDDEYDSMLLVTARELAERPGSRYRTADAVRKQLSRRGVGAVDYIGRYRTARYNRTDAEEALSAR